MKKKLIFLSKELDILYNEKETLISSTNGLKNEIAMFMISLNKQLKKKNELLTKEIVTSHVISTKPHIEKKILKNIELLSIILLGDFQNQILQFATIIVRKDIKLNINLLYSESLGSREFNDFLH